MIIYLVILRARPQWKDLLYNKLTDEQVYLLGKALGINVAALPPKGAINREVLAALNKSIIFSNYRGILFRQAVLPHTVQLGKKLTELLYTGAAKDQIFRVLLAEKAFSVYKIYDNASLLSDLYEELK